MTEEIHSLNLNWNDVLKMFLKKKNFSLPLDVPVSTIIFKFLLTANSIDFLKKGNLIFLLLLYLFKKFINY